MRRIEEAERLLAEHPLIGQARPHLHPDLRGWLVRPYLILYRVDPDYLSIVRIVHGARDLPSLFDA